MLGEKLTMLCVSEIVSASVSRSGVCRSGSVFPRLRSVGGVSGVCVRRRKLVGRRGGVFSDLAWRGGVMYVAVLTCVLSTLCTACGEECGLSLFPSTTLIVVVYFDSAGPPSPGGCIGNGNVNPLLTHGPAIYCCCDVSTPRGGHQHGSQQIEDGQRRA
jgi:hypothetical protein